MNKFLTTLNLFLAIVLVSAIGITQSSSASAANGTVSACANKQTGVLRIAPPKCKSTEKSVAWNMHGPQGEQGPRGWDGSDASVQTTLKTISYLGNPGAFSPCGSGSTSLDSYYVYDSFLVSANNLTSSIYWTKVPTCYMSFYVVD
jgi:hypothetical protein